LNITFREELLTSGLAIVGMVLQELSEPAGLDLEPGENFLDRIGLKLSLSHPLTPVREGIYE
jgi:hypothetical protein